MAILKKTLRGVSFALMIGDEGGILVQMQRGKVIRRLFAQSADATHTRSFDEALATYPAAPILVLVDMMDQSYVRQTLPPVSSFSIGKIVKRRMDKDFSPDDIKGYVLLEREKTGRKDWNYLMVSLANAPLLQKWLSFVVERPNPFRGMGLIPLEAEPLLTAIEKMLRQGKGEEETESLGWQILVSHHKVGGFRQIVLHDGRLIFTRMTQLIGDSLPAVMAGNIEQELVNTLEYLKRLGLQDTANLSVVVVASDEVKQALEPKNMKVGECHFFTPFELAELLELKEVAQPEDHFGDVVVSAFIARRRHLILPLHTAYTRTLVVFSRALAATRAASILAALCVLAWAAMSGRDWMTTRADIGDLESQAVSLKATEAAKKDKTKTLPKEINLYTDVETLGKAFGKRKYDPLAFVASLAGSLEKVALATAYHWTLSDPLVIGKEVDKRSMTADFDLRLTLPREPHEAYTAAAIALLDRIKTAFPDFELSHSELPGLLSDTKELHAVIDEAGTAPATVSASSDILHVTLKGPVAPAAPTSAGEKNGR